MRSIDRVVVPLRVLLVLVFVGLLVAQTFSLPGTFRYLAERNPDLGSVPWLLLAFSVVELLCIQVVIVCTWRLLTLVRADRIFSEESFGWVDGIVWALVVGWALLAGVSAVIVGVIYFTPELRDPGTPMLLFGIVLIGGVVVLTVVVLRALLRQAAVLRADMEDVI
ncbi:MULTISPECIES: DUF2975 domain-containing protein [unclassified Leifsonia]|uniref:DUF2975 domain-containing protein n=1 Tax=unclassified Leifsonia TaxID=2663824 RepID=UPI0006F5D163|nr:MULTISPECIES: DUF2975 domain-containing protein [unclassified Leifsonia]KQX05552.1 hypothetical protein ASC59_15735 [Leifsonia sp. Root1293]KRA09186.1 hypothetical protein ASD61_15730 [Leifsonia sp. Root60]